MPGAPGALVGSLLGLAVYAAALLWLGFAPAERRLVGALADRYRAAIP
ncbi:hypothetical protein [Halosegnis marinus]